MQWASEEKPQSTYRVLLFYLAIPMQACWSNATGLSYERSNTPRASKCCDTSPTATMPRLIPAHWRPPEQERFKHKWAFSIFQATVYNVETFEGVRQPWISMLLRLPLAPRRVLLWSALQWKSFEAM